MPREPYPSPQHPDEGKGVSSSPKKITFRHPGYGPDAQPLLIFPACDLNDTIDHELARTACAAVACNRFDGFFTSDVHGRHRVFGAQLPFIEEGYFFHVPRHDGPDHPYPVYPSFRHYSPPMFSQLPARWLNCSCSDATTPSGRLGSVVAYNIIKRDGTCRITNYTEQTEAAHIIPDGESEWFHARGSMICRAKINDESNFLLLKVDVHKFWDQRQFTIVPRVEDSQPEENFQWVTYVLKRQPSREVINLYHDVCLQPLTGVDILFLFCRFVWTVFESLDIFLEQGSARWLTVRNPTTGLEETMQFSYNKCRDPNFTQRGRSPRKSKRPASNGGENENGTEDKYRWGSGNSTVSGRSHTPSSPSSNPESSDQESRGRKRTRWKLFNEVGIA